MEWARDDFKKRFGFTPARQVRVRAPLELLGHLALHEHGLSLALTVDRHWDLAAAPRTDGRIQLASPATQGLASFSASRLEPSPDAGWLGVVKAMLLQLQSHGVPLRGFSAALRTSIPPGLGLGHAAALAAALALGYRELYPYALTAAGGATVPKRDSNGRPPAPAKMERLELARASHRAALQCTGPPPSLGEPVACLFARPLEAIELDGQSLAAEPIALGIDLSLVLCDSGARADWSGGQREAWRNLSESVAKRLGVSSLRSMERRDLPAAKKKLSEEEFTLLSHLVGEARRVVFGAQALRDGDLSQLGQYLYQSHESASRQHGRPELDLLVAMARSHDGCLGARLAGLGGGGATLNLVQAGREEDFMRHMARPYRNQPAHRAAPLLCRASLGAGDRRD